MISDEALSMAAAEYEQALLSSLPEACECDHSFSPKFEKKMRHLCHKAKYAPAYSALKRIACAVIAIILCGSMLLMLDADVRAAVIGLAKRAYQSYNMYFFEGEAGEDPTSQVYGFETVPEGYIYLDRMDTDSGATILYMREDGKYLDFSWYTSESGTLFIGGYEYDLSQVMVSGKPADLYIAKDPAHSNTIVWENAERNTLFQLTGYFEKDSLIQLAESICPIHDTKK